MAIMCGRSCTFNNGGRCIQSVCSMVAQDTKIHEEMLKRINQFTWFTEDGLYFGTVTDLCKYYGINRTRFCEMVQNGVFWVSALNTCIIEKATQKGEELSRERGAYADAYLNLDGNSNGIDTGRGFGD